MNRLVRKIILNQNDRNNKIYYFEPKSKKKKVLKSVTRGLFISNLSNFSNPDASDLNTNMPYLKLVLVVMVMRLELVLQAAAYDMISKRERECIKC